MRGMRVILMALCLFVSSAFAAEPTAAGRWRQIDDESGHTRSIIQIGEQQGVFSGIVEHIFFEPGEDSTGLCVKCEGALKGQKIVGMKILNGLKREGLHYSGGEILDPESGSVYRVKMTLSADGNSLDVRGFIGISLFGRTQTWYREDK